MSESGRASRRAELRSRRWVVDLAVGCTPIYLSTILSFVVFWSSYDAWEVAVLAGLSGGILLLLLPAVSSGLFARSLPRGHRLTGFLAALSAQSVCMLPIYGVLAPMALLIAFEVDDSLAAIVHGLERTDLFGSMLLGLVPGAVGVVLGLIGARLLWPVFLHRAFHRSGIELNDERMRVLRSSLLIVRLPNLLISILTILGAIGVVFLAWVFRSYVPSWG